MSCDVSIIIHGWLYDVSAKVFVGKSLTIKQWKSVKESVTKGLREQDKFFASFETRIKSREKSFKE